VDVDESVSSRIRQTEAERAQLLGLAFTITFSLAALGDLAGMGTLRDHGFMLCQVLLSFAVVVVVRWTNVGRRHASTIFAGGMSAVSAAGAAHLSQFGGLDGPWFYGSYTAPPVMIPMLLQLRTRVAWTATTVLAFMVVYFLGRPEILQHPMAHVPVVYLVTISGISIALGHYIYRLEVGSFVDVARLNAAAQVLEEQLRAGDEQPARLRQEIARQLHDDVAQLITGARLHLDGWHGHKTKDDAARRLAELLDELARRSRRMLDELRTPPTRGPLTDELERLRVDYRDHGLSVDLLIDTTSDVVIDAAHTEALVGCAREALTNAIRHARASEATISLHTDVDSVTLSVLDNGGGTITTVREGNGLKGIRERVTNVGGQVVLSDYADGLRLTVVIPRQAAA
jgi:signal transduction histidine kinase